MNKIKRKPQNLMKKEYLESFEELKKSLKEHQDKTLEKDPKG